MYIERVKYLCENGKWNHDLSIPSMNTAAKHGWEEHIIIDEALYDSHH